MIPKTIHYCWFGRNPKPELVKKCISSWEKSCPDYIIKEWNEDNTSIECAPLYVRQAYSAMKWAFVTDYIRLQIVYDNGGIYLDTDVEVIKNFNHLLYNNAFFGFEGSEYVNTGLGFGAVKGAEILRELMDDYRDIPFIFPNGEYNLIPCPMRNTEVFLRHGLIANGETQSLDDCVLVLSSEYLCPIDLATKILHKTSQTISIHHYSASWQTDTERKSHAKKARKRRQKLLFQRIGYFPKRIVRRIIGDRLYEHMKNILRGCKDT